ncbi:MAG: protein kinase [Candidatus Hydrogenedentes bacterium]|nr:protein kinase [Candidatus Hydrogenedentota bacterium]
MSDDNNYEILEEVGRGGMGIVYKATDKALNRTVALKFLPSQMGEEAEHLKRFRREAKAAAALNHPNIVTVFSTGEQDGKYYIAMEFVDGMTLSQLVRSEGAQGTKRVVRYMIQVADALDEAHDKGLIHRDIKPQNLLIDQKDRIKVTDFGLARFTHEHTELTADGARLGTPRYMSPEQCEALPLTHHTDIYSLGTVMFELLSGRQAFKAKNVLSVMRMIVDSPFPDIRKDNPKVPQAIAEIIAKMVARNIEDRYQSAAELKADLECWLESGEAPRAAGTTLVETRKTQMGRAKEPSAIISPRAGVPSKDFMIHFVEADRPWSEWISARLTEAEFELDWMAWNPEEPETSLKHLVRTIDPSTCLILVTSPTYLRTLAPNKAHPGEKEDWQHIRASRGIQILPVRVAFCDTSQAFADTSVINMTELDHDEGKKVLVDEARRRLTGDGKAAPEAQTPDQLSVDSTPSYTVVGVSNVPVEPNLHFTGRETILLRLAKTFRTKSNIVVLVQPDPAEAGYGLTELAVEYTDRNRLEYDVVWWIRADAGPLAMNDFGALARRLGILKQADTMNTQTVAALRAWLSNTSRWLLVFDQVARPEDLRPFIPTDPKGHILITSPSANWPSNMQTIRIAGLERVESVEFLLRRTRRFKTEADAELAATLADVSLNSSGDPKSLEGPAPELAELLGDAPLALELAGAYIAVCGLSLSDYRELFLVRHQAIWDTQPAPPRMSALVGTALSLTYEKLYRGAKDALSLLKACVYLHPSEISVSRLTSNAALFPKALAKLLSDEESLQTSIVQLVKYGLADEQDGALRLHELVQQVTRTWMETPLKSVGKGELRKTLGWLQSSRLEQKNPRIWFSSALMYVDNTFPEEAANEENWPACNALLAHAITVTRHAGRIGSALNMSAALGTRVGAYLQSCGDLRGATETYERAIRQRAQEMGGHDPDAAPLYRKLGRLYQLQRMPERALESYNHALSIDRQNGDENKEENATTLSEMGTLGLQMRNFAVAKRHFAQALKLDLSALGASHPKVGRDYTNLGYLAQESKEFDKAYEYFERALRIVEAAHEPDSLSIAPALKNIAGALRKAGKFEAARPHYEHVLQVDQLHQGEKHPDVAQDYNNLGFVLLRLGVAGEAKNCFLQALGIDEAHFGDEHYKVGIHKNNLAQIAREEGDFIAAKQYYKEAGKIFDRVYGRKDEHTQAVFRNLKLVRALLARQDKSGPKVAD